MYGMLAKTLEAPPVDFHGADTRTRTVGRVGCGVGAAVKRFCAG